MQLPQECFPDSFQTVQNLEGLSGCIIRLITKFIAKLVAPSLDEGLMEFSI